MEQIENTVELQIEQTASKVGRPKKDPKDLKSHDQIKEYFREYQRNAPLVRCDECNCEINKYKIKQHCNTLRHRLNLLEKQM